MSLLRYELVRCRECGLPFYRLVTRKRITRCATCRKGGRS